MAWIESHTVLRNHRKILPLSRALRLNIAQTIGHLHLLWHAALEQQENGDLSQWSDELIAELAGYNGDAPQFVRLLQEFGWLDGKMIHDWWDYSGRYLQGKYSRRPEKWKDIQTMYQKQPTNSTQTAHKQHTIPNQPNQPNQPKDSCAEPQATAAPAVPDTSDIFLIFPVIGKEKEWQLTEAKVKEYAETFPGLDIRQICKIAKQWCIDNPSRQKTYRGMTTFLSRWLAREQNCGGKFRQMPQQQKQNQPEVKKGKYASM